MDKTLVLIHATDMASYMTPESIIQDNRIERFDLCHLAVTIEETTIQTTNFQSRSKENRQQSQNQTDNMT